MRNGTLGSLSNLQKLPTQLASLLAVKVEKYFYCEVSNFSIFC